MQELGDHMDEVYTHRACMHIAVELIINHDGHFQIGFAILHIYSIVGI